MFDAFYCFQTIEKLLRCARRTFHSNDFKTVMVIKMKVLRRKDAYAKIVLNIG